jgi:trans-aconitate methyltransferase
MLLSFLFLFLAGCIIATIFSFNALWNTLKFGLPFVSTPRWAVDWLRDNLALTERDVVYELGCGSAPVLAALGKKFPQTQFIGIEIQWWPLLLAKWRTRKLPNITITSGDFLKTDLSRATLIYGFFITVMMPKVAKLLEQQLQSGVPVVSFGFALPGWTAEKEIANPSGKRGSKIRFYRSR